MAESGANPVGHFDSFEAMVRAHGRSSTSSYLLVTLFCDVVGMDAGDYIYFPRNRSEDDGRDQMVQRYRLSFYAHGIKPHMVLLQLPGGRIYIAPHVQEYLAHLDPECESYLTFYTVGVHEALARHGAPIPPFPRVGRVAQRSDDWDFYHVEPARPTQHRVSGVGINPGYDVDTGPEGEEGGMSQEHTTATSL